MRLGELRNMWLPRWWHSRHSRCCFVRHGCLLLFLRWHLLHWDHRQSLGHGHGRVGVRVEEFFVERREEDIDCFRVQLLEGLELLGMECAQGWQRWDSANQLPDRRERQSKIREFRLVDYRQRKDLKLLVFCALRPEELLSVVCSFSLRTVPRGLPWYDLSHYKGLAWLSLP